MTLVVAATADERIVIVKRAMVNNLTSTRLTQPELDDHFDRDIDRRSAVPAWLEAPLPDRLQGPFIQRGAETADDSRVADRAIAADNELDDHLALDRATPRLVRVVGLDLADDAWWLDS
jgi:hypothetical protein